MAIVHDPDFAALARWDDAECVLDVGANRGQSIASIRAVLPRAHIHSFEANPGLLSELTTVAEAMPPCTVHPYGLGENEATMQLYVPWSNGAPFLEESSVDPAYYLKPWVVAKFAERGGLELRPVDAKIRRGDDVALSPQIVKIDVEGAELSVIRGLTVTILRCRPVLLVENSDWHRVTAALGDLGYAPYRYHEGELVPFFGQCTNTFYLPNSIEQQNRSGENRMA